MWADDASEIQKGEEPKNASCQHRNFTMTVFQFKPLSEIWFVYKSLSLIGIQTKDKARVLGQIRENCNTSNFHTTNSENYNTTSFHPTNVRKIVSGKNFRKHYSYVFIVLYVKCVVYSVRFTGMTNLKFTSLLMSKKKKTPELFNVDYCTFRVSVSFAGSWPSVMSMEYTRDSSSMVVHSSP